MPMGHEEFPTRLDAVRSVAGWDQIEKLPFTVKAGEFHSSTTPFVWLKDNANPYPIQVCFGGYLAGGVRAEVWKESEGRGKCFQVSVEDLSLSNPQKDREIQKIEKIESLPLSQQVFQKDATQCHSVGGR